MKTSTTFAPFFLIGSFLAASIGLAQEPVHTTYLWHLEQPIYWPAPNAGGARYQTAWDSILAKDAGALHPQNDVRGIFALDDRVAAYQWRPRDAVNAMRGYPEAGAQVSYSGGLIENVGSLGAVGQLGYTSGWRDPWREARGWSTTGGKPRLDILLFPFHHALMPLTDPAVNRMELALYQQAYPDAWGTGAISQGLFPSEMAFAEHLIPSLVAAGVQWVVVSNAHLSRACGDYPYAPGSGGDNLPPPNLAEVQNGSCGPYNRISIDRGVSPANAVPFSYLPHWARHVDPASGAESRIIVVPAAQAESWQDGYSCFGVGAVNALAGYQNPTGRPLLLLLAHDGDNAFGGGYSYYMECTPNFVSTASAAGYRPTTVQQYLSDHPPPAGDLVHVEPGAWVNADGDFGAPSYLNWNWPPMNQAGQVDLAAGWAEDERNWAVIVAATNQVLTADALAGPPDLAQLYQPGPQTGDLERAWHFLLGSLNSGYMYYGKTLDMELKQTVACNEAVARAQAVHGGSDPIGPTVFLPQRYPDNPGGSNFGPLYHYRQEIGAKDFWVWTLVYDVSGVQSVVLYVRQDDDGVDPLGDDANQIYAGGAGVGAWTAWPMTSRAFPKDNVFSDPEIDFSILPTVIADLAYAQVTGFSDALLDYYVEAIDTRGQSSRSPIQHVWVGSQGSNPSGVHWTPAAPRRSDPITVFSPTAGKLHWGTNGWQAPAQALWPAGTTPFDSQSVETPLAGPDADGFYTVVLGPFGAGTGVDVVDFVIHKADGGWDNNQGQDYHIPILPDAPDGGIDSGPPDAGPDGGGDNGADAGPDAGTDAGADAAPDSGVDGGADAPASDPLQDAGGGDGADQPASGDPGPADTSGCGCATDGTNGTGGAGALGMLIALGALRRRSRSAPG
jgi:MYXO-CTERM domain-containing protein